MLVDDAVHRGDVPPPIDLAGHMRELSRALLPALLIAALVGIAVFFVRSELTDKQYSASIVTEIKPAQTLVPGDAFVEQMRAPFIELSTDTDVLKRVVSTVDPDIDASALAADVATTPGASPALLTFTVTADSPELARQLAQSVVSTVGEAANSNYARDTQGRRERAEASLVAAQVRATTLAATDPNLPAAQAELTQLQQQLSQLQSAGGDQLVVLSSPQQSTLAISPKPLPEALVAAVTALIIAAEMIVLLRGRFGSKPNRSWARRVAKKNSAKFDSTSGSEFPPLLTARIDTITREGAVPTGNSRHAATRKDSVVVVLEGDNAVYHPTHGYAAESATKRQPVVTMGLTDEWWRAGDVNDVDTIVVIVSETGKDRAAATRALERIREFGISTYLVLQSRDRGQKNVTTPTAQTKHDTQVETHAD